MYVGEHAETILDLAYDYWDSEELACELAWFVNSPTLVAFWAKTLGILRNFWLPRLCVTEHDW